MTDTITALRPRMKHLTSFLPGSFQAVQAMAESARKGGVPDSTLELVHLRVSQINGCSFCVDMGGRNGQTDEALRKLFVVAAWRDAPYFTDAERAALALAEAVTRLADRPDPVPDEIWDEAARHFDERQLAAIILWIATTNVFNRINVTTRQVAGSWPRPAE
jgi:AhpD family alkylhydroperoxidase